MSIIARFRSTVENLFRKTRRDEDLDTEVRGYVDLLAEEKLRTGMKPEEARRAARIELGGIEQVKEDVREVRAGAWLDSLLQDLRYGARMLRKNPGFTAVLLRPLPYTRSERLMIIRATSQRVGVHSPSYPDFLDWRNQSRTVS